MADLNRPTFHFTTNGWLNDVIPFRDQDGVYHLFADFNPGGFDWTARSNWVHATTRDFVRWLRVTPDALAPTPRSFDQHGCWTGHVTAHARTYYAHYTAIANWPAAGDRGAFTQQQAVATSRDLVTWHKPADVNPVIPAPPPGLGECFRDPCVWREGDRWRMVVGSEKPDRQGGVALLYESPDLIHWTYLHPLAEGREAETGYDFECPDFFPLGDRHVLITSRGPTRWQVGTYANDRFAMARYGIADGGAGNGEPTFYAAKTVTDDRGRRLLIGWVRDQRPADVRRAGGWAGTWSIPRVLSLRPDGSLGYEPVETITSLRRRHWRFDDVRLEPGGGEDAFFLLPDVRATAYELDVQFEPAAAGVELLGVLVRADDDLDEWTEVVYDAVGKALGKMPLTLAPGEGLRLRVFVDGCVVEAFANGRACWTGILPTTRTDNTRLGLIARGGAVVARSVDVWELQV